ncbi:MAG: DUF3054 domain-containing protein [Fimbriimonadales bacterium]|nr:DUF3054 domain-containing protein [Fimbriimonadales bacterium]
MRWGWMLSDALAITLFVLAGLGSHGTLDEFGLQRSLPPFLIGWFVAALLLGVYRAQPPRWALPLAWVVSVTLGIGIRNLLLGRTLWAIHPVFWAISLGGVALFTGLPRLVMHWVRRQGALAR